MFPDELDRALDGIDKNPEQYPPHDFGTRRMVLRRFPFVIVFRRRWQAWRSLRLPTVAVVPATGANAPDKPTVYRSHQRTLPRT